ncbi:hypothetical protein ACOMHN_036060 [Nucella lapillus]
MLADRRRFYKQQQRQYNQRYWQRLKADPERYARRIAAINEKRRLRALRQKKPEQCLISAGQVAYKQPASLMGHRRIPAAPAARGWNASIRLKLRYELEDADKKSGGESERQRAVKRSYNQMYWRRLQATPHLYAQRLARMRERNRQHRQEAKFLSTPHKHGFCD